jgi:hypothetical protein
MSDPHVGTRFPGESEEYRRAREELLHAEVQRPSRRKLPGHLSA